MLVLIFMASGVGCRSLRSHRRTRALTDARKFSLQGADYLQQKNYNEAAPLFSEALNHSDADDRAHSGMAEVLWVQEQYAEAISHMARAAELSDGNHDLRVRLGEMYLSEKAYDLALAQANQVLEKDWKHAEAWALKGRVLRIYDKYDESLDCYQRALIHKPHNPNARVALADLYHLQGRPQRALATLDQLADDQATEQIPARAWMLKGQSLAALGQHVEAKDCLRHAALCAEDCETQVLLDLAQVQYKAGELAEARICLGRALQNNPHDPYALNLQQVLAQSFDDISKQGSVPVLPAGWHKNSPAQ